MEGDAAGILTDTVRSHDDPLGAASPPRLTKVVAYPEPEGGYLAPGMEPEGGREVHTSAKSELLPPSARLSGKRSETQDFREAVLIENSESRGA